MRKENTVGLHLSILVVLLCLRFTSRAWPTCESPLLEFVGLASITSWTGPFKNFLSGPYHLPATLDEKNLLGRMQRRKEFVVVTIDLCNEGDGFT